MAVINVDDIYILNETGAQVDKVTGLFTKDEGTTEEEKAFAQLNIGASGGGGGGGRNFIDNAWFTINQRGATGASSNTYGLDRWLGVGTGYTVNSDGTVTITGAMVQRNDWASIWGKTVTISAMVVSGEIYSWSGPMTTGSKSIGGLLNAVVVSSSQINFSAVSNLKALKLELGSVSTLANDAPPEYAEELMKCNFYDIMLKTSAQYGYLGYGIADSATSTTILIPLPNNMRDATPTITTGGTIAVKGGTSGTHTITGITFKLRVTGGVLVTVATAGLTTGEFCLLQLNNTSSYINLSADL